MKKKKLKKKIKKLERKVEWLNDCERTLALRCDKLYHNDVETKDDISKLKDGKCCKDDIDKLRSEVGSLRFELSALNDKYAVLNLRTRMPYDEFAIKTTNQPLQEENNGN